MEELYLVRHAIAAERGEAWPQDALRPLTHEGVRRFKEVVRGLRALGVEVDLIVTSPLTRARQTAELLAGGLRTPPRIVTTKVLVPGVPPATALSALLSRRARRVAVVGHEPDLGRLLARLIGARRPIPFKKSAVCRVDVNVGSFPPQGTVVWHAPPSLLRRIRD